MKKVSLDDTTICYPAVYSPSSPLVSSFVEPFADHLDSSEGQELIYIPAKAIKARVSEYTLSHINKYGVDFEHEIKGIAGGISQISNLTGLERAAWNVYELQESVYVEKDPLLPFYRVYEYHKPLFMWHLVESEPLINPKEGICLIGDSIPIRRLFQLHLSFVKIVSPVLPIGILSQISRLHVIGNNTRYGIFKKTYWRVCLPVSSSLRCRCLFGNDDRSPIMLDIIHSLNLFLS